MKKSLVLFAACLTLTTTAFAATRWQGPGWYQVVEKMSPGRDSVRIIYLPRPFGSRDECQRSLLPDRNRSGLDEHGFDTYYDFSCQELPARPQWDR